LIEEWEASLEAQAELEAEEAREIEEEDMEDERGPDILPTFQSVSHHIIRENCVVESTRDVSSILKPSKSKRAFTVACTALAQA
jgi:hypothetical protein